MKIFVPQNEIEKLRPYPQKQISYFILLKVKRVSPSLACDSFWALMLFKVRQYKMQSLVQTPLRSRCLCLNTKVCAERRE